MTLTTFQARSPQSQSMVNSEQVDEILEAVEVVFWKVEAHADAVLCLSFQDGAMGPFIARGSKKPVGFARLQCQLMLDPIPLKLDYVFDCRDIPNKEDMAHTLVIDVCHHVTDAFQDTNRGYMLKGIFE